MRSPFPGTSPFYPGYQAQVANASVLDVAHAVGSARQAARSNLRDRLAYLQKAAQTFSFNQEILEHTVRMTGMPLRVIHGLLEDIPIWLHSAGRILAERLPGSPPGELVEALSPGLEKVHTAPDGFCYAVIPGNDPRSSALVAANLCALGVPFVMRASPRDAIAPLVIQAIIAGGFDPHFANLLYFDPQSNQTSEKHFRLVDASHSVWTFGPNDSVDRTLRFETLSHRAIIELKGTSPEDLTRQDLHALLDSHAFSVEPAVQDHFEGKNILRHNSGNCAAVLHGELDRQAQDILQDGLAFPLGCTSIKTLLLVGSPNGTILQLADLLASLKTGDPLDADTQVGYISEQTLDYLQDRLRKHRLRAQVMGGERLSAIQARPALISSQEDLPDLFGQEIPAYLLNVRACEDSAEAVAVINRFTYREPRLATSLIHLPPEEQQMALSHLRSHAILIDRPTSHVIPVFHEGNDYLLELLNARLVVRGFQNTPTR